MHICALTALLAISGTSNYADGTLLFVQHGNKPVASYTQSDITHVALLRNIGGATYVFEATPGKVRGLQLDDYQAEFAAANRGRATPMTLWALEPRIEYTAEQRAALKRFTRAQLGRRYSIKGYLREQPATGVHCAEFVASALVSTGRFVLSRRYAIDPGTLFVKVSHGHLPPRQLPVPSEEAGETWCQRQWQQWSNFQKWCSWAFVETWLFCR